MTGLTGRVWRTPWGSLVGDGDPHGAVLAYGPDDPASPEDATGVAAVRAAYAAVDPTPPAEAPTPAMDTPTPEPEPEAEAEAPEPAPVVDGPAPPPLSGAGSGASAWRAHADALGVAVDADATRAEIVAAIAAAGHPTE